MKKIVPVVAAILITAAASTFAFIKLNEKRIINTNNNTNKISDLNKFMDIAYRLDNGLIKMNGNNIKYFGNEIRKDLNNDGKDDIVFLFTKNDGGSGTFFYVTSAVSTEDGYIGTNSILLGDRVSPQSTDFVNNTLFVNYSDRGDNEPMTAKPSIGKSKAIDIVNNNLSERKLGLNISLTSKKWTWIKTQYNNDTVLTPNKPGRFTITFDGNGNFTTTTDCNSGFGSYKLEDGNRITFGQMGSTEMYCEGSQEYEFAKFLSNVSGYMFNSNNELILNLKFDSGDAIFK